MVRVDVFHSFLSLLAPNQLDHESMYSLSMIAKEIDASAGHSNPSKFCQYKEISFQIDSNWIAKFKNMNNYVAGVDNFKYPNGIK